MFFPDWRERLIRNLSRRSDGRWDPLTWIHATNDVPHVSVAAATPSRPLGVDRDTALWKAIECAISELTASKEIFMNTPPEYVIGHLCRELQAKGLITATGAQR